MSNMSNEPPKRLLGDLRIFQAVCNDLDLRHEVFRFDGQECWAYVYDGVDPYGLEDSHFPTVVEGIERLVAEASRVTVDYIDFAPYAMPVAERRKLDIGDIYINQVKHNVPECGWYIRSKNRHDYQTCKCGKLSIDGGSWYTALSGDVDNAEMHVVMYKYLPEGGSDDDGTVSA